MPKSLSRQLFKVTDFLAYTIKLNMLCLSCIFIRNLQKRANQEHSLHKGASQLSTCSTQLTGDILNFFSSKYCIQHCFIRRPSDSTVSEDAKIEPRTAATSALAVRRSNQSARSHPHTQVPKQSVKNNLTVETRIFVIVFCII
jgi:hypothetical protein